MNEQGGALTYRGAQTKKSLSQVVLCVDSESWNHPEVLGLDDECLPAQSWLTVFHDAGAARSMLCNDDTSQKVWVVSSDTVEGINLAAAIKHDNVDRLVSLVSFEGSSGSLMGRCQAAGVELIRSKNEFVKRYSEEKERSLPAVSNDARNSFPINSEVKNLPVEEPIWQSSIRSAQAARSSSSSVPGHSSMPSCSSALGNANANAGLKGQDLALSKHKDMAEVIPESNMKRALPVLHSSASDDDAFVLAVIGGSGGVGKSTIAASAAVLYQRMGHKTLLLDADLQFGDMAYLLGSKQPLEITELLENPQRVARLKPENGLPALLAAPKSLEQSELIMERIAELVAFLRSQFEIIIINTGAFWSEQHAQIIESADQVLFLLDQRPSSIRACSHALDLCARCGIPTQSFLFVLNFCSRKALLTSLDASCALQGVKVEELKDGGKEVGELLSAGLPQELIVAKNPFCESLEALCRHLLPYESSETQSGKGEKEVRKRGRLLGLRKRKVAACL